MITLHVEVTASDVERGLRKDGQSCPIALALQRRGYTEIEVDADVISFADGYQHFYCEPPASARTFICAFDNGAEVVPFTFDLKAIDREGL